jgi:hypothetical protein
VLSGVFPAVEDVDDDEQVVVTKVVVVSERTGRFLFIGAISLLAKLAFLIWAPQNASNSECDSQLLDISPAAMFPWMRFLYA